MESHSQRVLFGGILDFAGGISMKAYIVWNEARTEGFATVDKQLAYETRKGATGNCHNEDGKLAIVALEFIGEWGDGNCTIEEVSVEPKEIIHPLLVQVSSGKNLDDIGEILKVERIPLETDEQFRARALVALRAPRAY